jgi:hypothetical protein
MNLDQQGGETPIGARDALAVAALLVVTAAILHAMGQPWWCAQGDLSPWSSAVDSAHNSQHLGDPYTLTHVLHGFAFYALLWAVAGARWSPRQRFLVALAAESAWELFENTDFVINRYREATISLDYFGDSIINSMGDIVACAAGYLAAAAIPTYASIATFAGVEILLMLWIRDSLLLNILMLVWPIEAIKNWQTG